MVVLLSKGTPQFRKRHRYQKWKRAFEEHKDIDVELLNVESLKPDLEIIAEAPIANAYKLGRLATKWKVPVWYYEIGNEKGVLAFIYQKTLYRHDVKEDILKR